MRIWRGHLDLPSRLEADLPRWASEALVAFAAIGLAVGVRLAIESVAPGVVPFALTFPAIALATLLAGSRAGLITLVGCQLLVWYFILPPIHSFRVGSATTALNLMLVTIAQLMILWVIDSYRREVRVLRDIDRRQIDSLSLALHEIDHRTKNNFQIAVSLLTLQSRAADDPTLKAALERAVTRLQAIASVYRNLAISSADLTATRLHDHLEEICSRLREGLLLPGITLELEADRVVVPHDLAIRMGLIVNELVTNAAKHAFPGGIGHIHVRLALWVDHVELVVRDDGCGLGSLTSEAQRGDNGGLGTRLVALLARQINARTETRSERGTSHRFLVPNEDVKAEENQEK